MERSTIFHGKIHYFDWAIFNCYVSSPEGKWEIACKHEAFEKSSTWWAMPTRCQSLPLSPKNQTYMYITYITNVYVWLVKIQYLIYYDIYNVTYIIKYVCFIMFGEDSWNINVVMVWRVTSPRFGLDAIGVDISPKRIKQVEMDGDFTFEDRMIKTWTCMDIHRQQWYHQRSMVFAINQDQVQVRWVTSVLVTRRSVWTPKICGPRLGHVGHVGKWLLFSGVLALQFTDLF